MAKKNIFKKFRLYTGSKQQKQKQEFIKRRPIMKKIKNLQQGINSFKRSAKAQGIKIKDIKGAAKGYSLNRIVNNPEYAKNFSIRQLEAILERATKDLNTLLRPEELRDVLEGKDVNAMMSQDELAQRYAYDEGVKEMESQVDKYHPDFFDNMTEEQVKASFAEGKIDRSYDGYAKREQRRKVAAEYGA